MQKTFIETDNNYKITTDPILNTEEFSITPEIQKIIQKYPQKLRNREQGLTKELDKLCKKYPDIPQFKNYLCTAYKIMGNTEKAYEVNDRLLEEHPDYLWGKTNRASQFVEEGTPEKVPEILGLQLKIDALYPEREVFHLAEVLAMHKSAVKYYIAINEREKVLARLSLMTELDPDHQETVDAREMLMHDFGKSLRERTEKEAEFRRNVEGRSYDKSVQTEEEPLFTHSEIDALYSNGMRIDHAVIKEILALPRQTLIQDLELVLQDSINRFEYFLDKTEKEGWNEEENNFPVHALFLLAELKAEDSLSSVLNLLRQGEEFLDFWFSDLLTEMVWQIIYHLGQNKLEALKEFLMEADLYTYSRNPVNKAVTQMALHHPEHKSEIIDWYADLFEFFLSNTDNVRIIDTDLISFMVWNCIDIKARELIPTIKELYNHDLVNPYMVGTFTVVKKDMEKSGSGNGKYEVYDIYGRYEEVLRWSDNQPSNNLNASQQQPSNNYEDSRGNNNNPLLGTFERETPKVGRNDPCPCGSGRKYKHCCMK